MSCNTGHAISRLCSALPLFSDLAHSRRCTIYTAVDSGNPVQAIDHNAIACHAPTKSCVQYRCHEQMILREAVKLFFLWLICHTTTTLSLPTSKGAKGAPSSQRSLSDRVTSILDNREEQSMIPLNSETIASLGLAEAAAFSQAVKCKSVRQLYWVCGASCSMQQDTYVQWTAGNSFEIPYSK